MMKETNSFDGIANVLLNQREGMADLESKIQNLEHNQLRLEKSAYDSLNSIDTTMNLIRNSMELFTTIYQLYEYLGQYTQQNTLEDCKQNTYNLLEIVKEQQSMIKKLESTYHQIIETNIEVSDAVRGMECEIANQAEKIAIVHKISYSLINLLDDTLCLK